MVASAKSEMASPESKDLVPFTRESLEVIKQHIAKNRSEEYQEDEDLKPNTDLEVGKKLPFVYGALPQELVSEPLEDVDPYYKNKKIFMVLNKKRTIFRFNATWCTLSPFSLIRRTAIKVLVHPFFQMAMILVIMTDSLFMSMSNMPDWGAKLQTAFLGVYIFEIFVKFIARGIWTGSFYFFGDPWNWLDFTVTLIEIIARFPPQNLFTVLIIVKCLRILKIIPLIQGIRSYGGVLIHCLKKLSGVIMLTLFYLSVFSLIGMGFFMGNLKHKCLRWPHENNTEVLHNKTGNPDYSLETDNFYYLEGARSALLCGNTTDAGLCPEGYVCVKAGVNPDDGYTNFDNFGWALLALFRLMMQDYSEALYHQVLYASGKIYIIFFIVISFWFTFYLASLFLGIIIKSYEEEKQKTAEKAKKIEPKFKHTIKECQEGDKAAEITQIEMKKRSPISMTTTLDMSDDATLRHEEDIEKSRKKCPLFWYKFARSLLIWDCSPCWLKLKEFIHNIVMDPFADLFLVLCIILNIYFLALEHYPMSEETFSVLVIGNLVFTGIFTAEMIFKIIAMHPYEYFQVGWNIFDSLIVLQGLAELYLANVSGLSVFRIFRLLRIFKLGKYWPTFNILILTLNNSLMALKNLILLFFIFILFSTVFGQKLFASSYKENVCNLDKTCELPRWHMVNFFYTYLLVFRILCGEWIETLWDCLKVASEFSCIPFYLMVILIGNFLIIYLFLALVNSFSLCKTARIEETREAKNLQQAMRRIKNGINYMLSKICKTRNVSKEKMDNVNEMCFKENISDHTLSDLSNTQIFLQDKEKSSDTEKNTVMENESQSLIPSPSVSETVPIASGESDIENLDNKDIQSKSADGSSREKVKQSSSSECSTVDIISEELIYEHEKLKHLKKDYGPDQISKVSRKGKFWKNIRKTCCKIVENSIFQCFIGIVTLVSTGVLAFEDIYIDQRKTIKILLEYADMIFTYIFILEMLLKLMAYGFKAYFKNGWYRLDFMVVIVFCLSLIGKSREELKPLVSIKFLRALRVLSQFEKMKVVVRALIKTTLPALNVFLFGLMIWLTFSIMGVNLFAGKFYRCFGPETEDSFLLSEVFNRNHCESLTLNESFSWKKIKVNFDNVGNGFLALLQVATFNGWMDIMYSASDSVDVDIQPVYDNNAYAYFYFINFVILGLFIPLSMLIGAIVANFNKHKQGGSNIFITVGQKKLCRVLKKLMCEDSQKPMPRPGNKFRGLIFDMVTSQVFNVIILVLICVQAIVMMTESDEQSISMVLAHSCINLALVILYTVECVLKLTAFHCHYFSSGWNIFDFVVVVFSLVGLLIPLMTGFMYLVPPVMVQLVRLFRIFHILRPGKGPRFLHDLLRPLMLSLPALLNTSLLLFLVMFVYAIFGMHNFAYVKKEYGINDVSNFETFCSSFLCLFQVTIFAGWDGMLLAIFASKPDCDPDKINPGTQVKGDCGDPFVGIIYFVSFIFISWIIIVNMYIIIVTEFLYLDLKKKVKSLSEDDFRRFFQVWKRFDPERTQYIDSSKLSDFAAALHPPLSIAKPNKGQLVAMDLPMAVGDRIHCLDILLALTKRVMGKDGEVEKVLSEIESGFVSTNPFKITYEPITTTLKRKQEAVSATIIQRAYKSYRSRQNDKNASDICMIDGDRGVHNTKEDSYFDKIEENATIQSQI